QPSAAESARAQGGPRALVAAAPALAREAEPAEPSELEKRAKRELEAQVRLDSRSDRILTTDGRTLNGRIVQEAEKSVRILRSFGDSGEMGMTLPRSQVRSVERDVATPPPISYRDVRFK